MIQQGWPLWATQGEQVWAGGLRSCWRRQQTNESFERIKDVLRRPAILCPTKKHALFHHLENVGGDLVGGMAGFDDMCVPLCDDAERFYAVVETSFVASPDKVRQPVVIGFSR